MPTPHGSLPRVRTVCTVAHPWPTFELDGTATPESLSFTYAEDLNDDRVKVEVTFMAVIDRGAPEPETFTQRGNQLRAKEAAELATLTAEWQSTRNVHAGSPAVLAVLDLHQPHRRYAIVQCDHCQTDSESPETDHVPWPCATYTALTDSAEQRTAPVTVNIAFHDNGSTHSAINRQLLAEYRAYPSPFRR